MSRTVIKFENIFKEYRLGALSGGTLKGDLQSWMARIKGKEDPNAVIGSGASKGNQRFLALNDVSFTVNQGDTLGIIGRNGAGKSTLLKLLSRVTAPSKGSIYINGRVASMLEVGTGFHPELSGRENVYLNGAILGMSKTEISRKFDDIVEFSEMGKFIDTPVKRYSSGMYVKLAFAVAAHLDSEILVMDEVLAVGDSKFQEKCLGKMGDVASNEGRTVLYVSHNLGTVSSLCNRCILLEEGRIAVDSETQEVISIYKNGATANKSYVDLSKVKRPYPTSQKAVMLFIQTEKIIYEMGEPLIFDLDWEVKEDFSDIILRCGVWTPEESPAGICFSEPFSGTKGEKIKTKFAFDTSRLCPGRYCFELVLNSVNSFGTFEKHDAVKKSITFEVSASKKYPIYAQWNRDWGPSVYKLLVDKTCTKFMD